MKSIIVYDTATGHTRALANKMKKVLEKYNHDCEIYRDKEIRDEVQSNPKYFDPYDLLLLGSCTHGNEPAITFKKFIDSIKDYDFQGKSLLCFSSSGGQQTWKNTCSEIQEQFPEMKHLGNFGCQGKSYDPAIKGFEEFIKSLT